MKRINVKDREHWHEIRREYVGGSEIGSLFNAFRHLDSGELIYRHLFAEQPKKTEFIGSVSPYASGVRLYHEKAGNLQPEFVGNARVEAGTFMEPAIAAWMKDRKGWDIRKVEDYIAHETVGMMGASLDYEIMDHPKGHAAMDCKDQAPWVWRDKWLDGDNDNPEPPLHIVLQIQHQMACAEMNHGVAAVYAAGIDLYDVDVPRNDNIIGMIEEAVTAFEWALKNEQQPDIKFDFSVARDLYESAEAYEYDMTDSKELLKLVETFELSKKMSSNWYAAKEAAFDEILSVIGKASRVRLADGRILEAPTRKRRGFTSVVAETSFRQLSIKQPKKDK